MGVIAKHLPIVRFPRTKKGGCLNAGHENGMNVMLRGTFSNAHGGKSRPQGQLQ